VAPKIEKTFARSPNRLRHKYSGKYESHVSDVFPPWVV